MDKAKELEFEYAKRLRESVIEERRNLYTEAYSVVSKFAMKNLTSREPEKRTAGTSKSLIGMLSFIVDGLNRVLEIGCGRGYTCLNLATQVDSMVGIEVSQPSLAEARKVLSAHGVHNVDLKHLSGLELSESFGKNEFDACLSIDVLEHLHPEDAVEHLRQVFGILRPGGKYIIVMPSRLDGPHDITKEVFPREKMALGFHLNESTYRELMIVMKTIGYCGFRSFYKNYFFRTVQKPIVLPAYISVAFEAFYSFLPEKLRWTKMRQFISIKLVAYKPE